MFNFQAFYFYIMINLTAKMLSLLKEQCEYTTADTVSFNTLLRGDYDVLSIIK